MIEYVVIHPSYSSSKLVRSWWSVSWLVLILSFTSLSGSLNQWYHLCILYSFLWCTPRFRTWPTPFHSLYNSSWLGDLKKFPQISFVCWWHPAVHLFHSYKFCSISWNTNHHFQWHSLLDELEQIASQSIKNWISSHWHKTTASQIFWSNKLISQQWYHPSQFLCSQSWLHLWLWHVFLWSNQLCIQILSFSYPRHPSNSSSSSSFYSHSSCKFTCLQQTWLLQFTLLWHLTNKSQQTSTHSKFIGTCHHKHFKISTYHTNTQKTTLASYQTKNWLQNLSPHIQNTYKSTTYIYLYNSLSFPSHSVSTRSSDSLVLSIPYVRSSLGKRAFSVIGPRLWNSLPPDTRNSSSLPIFRSRLKTHLFKIAFPP